MLNFSRSNSFLSVFLDFLLTTFILMNSTRIASKDQGKGFSVSDWVNSISTGIRSAIPSVIGGLEVLPITRISLTENPRDCAGVATMVCVPQEDDSFFSYCPLS